MKNITKLLFVIAMTVLIPMKHFGQTPYRSYAEDGIMINFLEIDELDFRLYLLYNIEHEEQFSLQAEDQNGLFIITPSNEASGSDFLETFERFYNNAYTDYRLIDKAERYTLVPEWKEHVTSMYFASITMDVALSRATNENNHCVDSDPFCTSDVITFDAATSSQTANQLEGYDFDDGCIGSSYNPSWYHMRINIPGQFVIHMEGHDPNNGTNRDIDFCIWGPYEDPTSACVAGLTTNKIIDCCYSSSYTEDIYLGYLEGDHHHNTSHGTINYHVPEVGEYYILMICNFSQQPCTISFTKTEGSGPGETDCGILPGIATNGGPYCVGETINLFVNSQAGATYSWTGPNGFSSTQQNPVIPNCTYEMGGVYTCVTTVDGQTTTGTTDVIIYPEPIADFEAPAVCFGETTVFTSTATTNPAGHDFTAFHWDFGDGEESEEQNVTHTYAAAGTYQVTYRVQTNRRCEDEITKDVVVHAMPVATATVNPTSVIYGGVATLTADAGVPGTFTYHWEPANMVTNPNSQTTQTVPIQATQTFTCTVTNTEGGCVSTTQVTALMAGSDLSATATADQYEICEDESTTLHAIPVAGTGNYTYSWSPSNTLSSASSQNPVASPPLGSTTYTCTVSDGLTIQEANVTIVVYPKKEIDNDAEICSGETYSFYGQSLSTSGVYNHTLQTQHGCDSVVHLHLTVNPVQQTDFTLNGICDSYEWAGQTYTTSDNYQHTFSNIQGCDSTVTMHLHLQYTPSPVDIYPTDPDNVAPHWVITATEFQINSYNFGIYEQGHPFTCHWDSIAWSFENPDIEWLLEPDTTTIPVGKKCKIYVLDHVDDTVWLRATIYNECAPQGVSQRYWFICSFYGVDDQPEGQADFSVIPNPNNGQMTLRFEKLTGKVDIKVYDMTGHLIDNFSTYSIGGPETLPYDMKVQSEGIYFFVATGKEGTVAKKVVVKY